MIVCVDGDAGIDQGLQRFAIAHACSPMPCETCSTPRPALRQPAIVKILAPRAIEGETIDF